MAIKILLADDDDLLRNLVKEVLEEEEYIVIEASDGQEALELFYENSDVNLIILDVMMPKIDGIKVLDEIRKLAETPVLMLTALGDSASELAGLRNGANDYVSKPFHYEILLERIKNSPIITAASPTTIIPWPLCTEALPVNCENIAPLNATRPFDNPTPITFNTLGFIP